MAMFGVKATTSSSWDTGRVCYSQTEHLQKCRDRISIFYISDAFIGCWLLTNRISIFYMSVTELAD